VMVLLAAWWLLSLRASGGVVPGSALGGALVTMQAAALALLWHGVWMLAKRQWQQARAAETPSAHGASQLLHRLGLAIVLISAAIATICGVHFLLLLGIAMLAGIALGKAKAWLGWALMAGTALFGIMMALATELSVKPDATLAIELGDAYGRATFIESLWVGLKAGLLSFGGAYTAVPILEQSVTSQGWMRSDQVLQGLAVVQALPAPLVSLAGYVGLHSAANLEGGTASIGPWLVAMAMLTGVYLPAFAFTLIGHEAIEEATASETLHGVLESAGACVIGVMFGAAALLIRPALGLGETGVKMGVSSWVLLGVFLSAVAVMAWTPTRCAWWLRPALVVGAAVIGMAWSAGNA
jgi:chromate transporter